jgi:hypothetical protein
MPLSRRTVANEYALGGPELYKGVDQRDPEAVLDGVAMAGLVGVLRQLGDLAEYVLPPNMLLPPRPCYLGCLVFLFLQTCFNCSVIYFFVGVLVLDVVSIFRSLKCFCYEQIRRFSGSFLGD